MRDDDGDGDNSSDAGGDYGRCTTMTYYVEETLFTVILRLQNQTTLVVMMGYSWSSGCALQLLVCGL